jgi:hypothetical protein
MLKEILYWILKNATNIGKNLRDQVFSDKRGN